MIENLQPLPPVAFFAMGAECRYFQGSKEELLDKKYILPSLEKFYGSPPFADFAMGWSEEGLFITVRNRKPLHKCFYPLIQEGDSVEVFIDTRDVKTSGMTTRFCHHFYFLPEFPEGEESDERKQRHGEISYFRTDDAHPHCDPDLLLTSTFKKFKSYTMHLFIPKECLFGYDPLVCPRLGFTYRLNRLGGDPQFFSIPSPDYSIEQQPSLWASLKLIPRSV